MLVKGGKMDKEKIYDFLKKYGLCVLSTASKNSKPQSAVMSYVIRGNSLFVFTEKNTRKYKNIAENNLVSIVVGGLKDDPSVQIDGTINEISQDEGTQLKTYTLSIHPEWNGYFDSPEGRWFEIKPSWMRYSDFSTNPRSIFEITV